MRRDGEKQSTLLFPGELHYKPIVDHVIVLKRNVHGSAAEN